MRGAVKSAKRAVIFMAGISVLLVGIIMLVFPGPGIIIALLGLVILSSEFTWARTAREGLKSLVSKKRG